MQQLTPTGKNIIANVAQRYNLSQDAVLHMLTAVNNGGLTMAQFNCPELGGGGQWMSGGMTMVGDMFNNGLKNTVDNLCSELANILANNQMFPVIPAGTPGSNQWWPQDLGAPFSSGGQNDIRYAVFPNRLAVERFGDVTVYDTLDHQIGGVSQQQGGDTSLSFSSQYGTISVNSLPIISGSNSAPISNPNFAEPQNDNFTPQNSHWAPEPSQTPVSTSPMATSAMPTSSPESTDEVFTLLEKLASLRDAGVISDDDFNNKKTDLLNRI